jgi:hypothetical protein
MKTMLLILMILANMAMAQATMSDAEMKTLLVGTWTSDDNRTFIFQPDGKWLVGDVAEKWDIQGGKLIEIRSGFGAADLDYSILLLTKHEFLARENSHGQGYIFLTRQEETPD